MKDINYKSFSTHTIRDSDGKFWGQIIRSGERGKYAKFFIWMTRSRFVLSIYRLKLTIEWRPKEKQDEQRQSN